LDWTEGALIALYFAVKEKEPVVWMLNPFELNALSAPLSRGTYNIYPLTWLTLPEGQINIGSANIKAAWQNDEGAVELPVAVPATYIHARMAAQRSCFTVHGQRKESLCKLVENKDIIKKYSIDNRKSQEILEELRVQGITRATLFPEPDVLAKDLTGLFRPDLAGGDR